VLDARHEFPRRVEIAFGDEELVSVHAMNLHRDAARPGIAELAGRDASAEQQSPGSVRLSLRELLSRERRIGAALRSAWGALPSRCCSHPDRRTQLG